MQNSTVSGLPTFTRTLFPNKKCFRSLAHLHVVETHPERVRARVAGEEEHELRLLQVARRQTLLDVGGIKEGKLQCLKSRLTYRLQTVKTWVVMRLARFVTQRIGEVKHAETDVVAINKSFAAFLKVLCFANLTSPVMLPNSLQFIAA